MKKDYGFYIVNSGEQAVVYDLEGGAHLIEGPRRMFLWREKFEKLRRYTASQTEYLIIKKRDGSVTHQPGPCSIFRNPVIHDSIVTKSAYKLDAHEVVVVYQHGGSSAGERTVKRYLKYGPTMFVPAANEWLHKFCWHGVDPENKTKFVLGLDKFTKLKLTPEQFYYNVDEIRTSDNGLVRVKLMVFYEINDVDTMLGVTDDPIGDIISALTADVTSFAAAKSYVEFVENSCDLNELENYPQLAGFSKKSGIRVTKLVFRGYFAAPKIQANHDAAFDKRTNLHMQFEREEQTQDLQDLELDAERQRIIAAHQLQLAELKQEQKLSLMKLNNNQELETKKVKEELNQKKTQAAAQLSMRQKSMEQKIAHLTKLKDMGVDLTQYVLNEAAIPEKVTHISNGNNGSMANRPQVHFHLNPTHNVTS